MKTAASMSKIISSTETNVSVQIKNSCKQVPSKYDTALTSTTLKDDDEFIQRENNNC